MSKHKKIRYIIHHVKPTAQLLFKIRFPKGGLTCRGQVVNPRHQTPQGQSVAKPAEYPSWVARCDIKGFVSAVLNPIFSKKVQGQKHPGRWGIVEHQIPSIKVLFKTNTKGHKHPSSRLLSKSKIQLVNQRKQKVAFSPGTAHSPEIQSYRTWWGAASPILNDTPVLYIYVTKQKVIRRKHIVQPTGFGACSSTCCQWDGEDVPAPWERSNSHPPVRVQKSCVNQFI